MSYRSITIAIAFLFLCAAIFLTYTLEHTFTHTYYWSASFINPHKDASAYSSYDFAITNETPSKTFAYTITNGDTVLVPRTNVIVMPHTTATIIHPHSFGSATVTVYHNDEKVVLKK